MDLSLFGGFGKAQYLYSLVHMKVFLSLVFLSEKMYNFMECKAKGTPSASQII